MALKICSCGKLTGYRNHCAGRITTPVKGPSGAVALDKKAKRRIDQAIRESGQIPVKDM